MCTYMNNFVQYFVQHYVHHFVYNYVHYFVQYIVHFLNVQICDLLVLWLYLWANLYPPFCHVYL